MGCDLTVNVVISLDAETRKFLAEQSGPGPGFDFAAAFTNLEASLSKISDALTTLATDVADATAAAKAHLDSLQAKSAADAAQLADLETQLATAKAAVAQSEADEPAELAQIADLEKQIADLKAMLAATDPTNPAVAPPSVVVGPGPDVPPGTTPAT